MERSSGKRSRRPPPLPPGLRATLGGSESAGHAVPLAEEDVPAWNASVGKHELRAWKAASLAAERVTAMDSWVTGSGTTNVHCLPSITIFIPAA